MPFEWKYIDDPRLLDIYILEFVLQHHYVLRLSQGGTQLRIEELVSMPD